MDEDNAAAKVPATQGKHEAAAIIAENNPALQERQELCVVAPCDWPVGHAVQLIDPVAAAK